MDKKVRIGVDSSEAKNFQSSIRQSAEQLARDMIKSSRSYSTSSKEVLKDIEEQIRAIEKRNRLDQDFQKTRLASAKDTLSSNQYSQASNRISSEAKTDQLQTKLLREIIDSIKSTSKEEIREDRKSVNDRISKSRSVGQLGSSGDEFSILKETVQQDILSDVKGQERQQKSGFNMGGAARYGQEAAQGEFGNVAMMGGMNVMSKVAANPMTLLAALPLLLAGHSFNQDKKIGEKLRGFGVSNQMGVGEMINRRQTMGSEGVSMGMTGIELMAGSTGFNKSLGGRNFSTSQMAGLQGITKSRDISPELLSQTLGFSRYGAGGDLTTVVKTLEKTIRENSSTDKEFRRKLIQLPEMMNVYNSMASQILQTTGSVNQTSLSGYISGISENFGVEGANLQRYSTGISKAMGGGNNSFVRAIQANIIRQQNPNLSNADLYQKTLEIQQDPTSDKGYMKEMFTKMKSIGGGKTMSPEFRSWMMSSGFGASESQDIFEKGYDPSKMASGGGSEAKNLAEYKNEASKFYATAEKTATGVKNAAESINTYLAESLEGTIKKAVKDGVSEAWIETNNKNPLTKFGQMPGGFYPNTP